MQGDKTQSSTVSEDNSASEDWIDKWASDWSDFVFGEKQAEHDEHLAQRSLLAVQDLEARAKASLNLTFDHIDESYLGSAAVICFRCPRQTVARTRKGELMVIVQMPERVDIPIGVQVQGLRGSVREHTGSSLVLSVDPKWLSKWVKFLNKSKKYAAVIDYTDQMYKRRMEALEDIVTCLRMGKGHHYELAMALIGRKLPVPAYAMEHQLEQYHFIKLNDAQKEAVVFCTQQYPMCALQGPPGTGKTTVVASLIHALVGAQKKVLACAPSHVAVDNLTGRMGPIKALRLGNTAKIDESSMNKTLNAKTKRSLQRVDEMFLQRQREQDADPTMTPARRDWLKNTAEREYRSIRREEEGRIIRQSEVVFCTCSGANLIELQGKGHTFDYVIVDEAGQVIILDAWPAMKLGKIVILVGDPKQLPATIKTKSRHKMIGDSLLGTLMEVPDFAVKHSKLLNLQYRMLPEIMQWSSERFYDGRLKADVSVRKNRILSKTMIWIDTACFGLRASEKSRTKVHQVSPTFDREEWAKQFEAESLMTEGEQSARIEFLVKLLEERSISNYIEAQVIVSYLKSLQKSEVWYEINDVGIVCMYGAQSALIEDLINSNSDRQCKANLKVATVDGFQGNERDVIILSLVRSNPAQVVGFLDDARRINVAATRAKKLLVVIGDSRTVCSSDTLQSLFQYIQSIPEGDIKHASDYLDPSQPFNTPQSPEASKTAQKPCNASDGVDSWIPILKKITPTSGPVQIGPLYPSDFRQIRRMARMLNLSVTEDTISSNPDDSMRRMAIVEFSTPPSSTPSSCSARKQVDRGRRHKNTNDSTESTRCDTHHSRKSTNK